jgi:hypothetical protein
MSGTNIRTLGVHRRGTSIPARADEIENGTEYALLTILLRSVLAASGDGMVSEESVVVIA